jgi:DNA polymerase-3 subunit beta
MWAERTILANVAEDGSCCVASEVLRALIGSLSDGNVSLVLEDTSLTLKHMGSEWKLLALTGDDFPKAPLVDGEANLRLSAKELREMVDKVLYAVADDHSRPVLTGVLFKYDGEDLILVATDTHRLAVSKLTRDGIGSEVEAIVPEKALKAIKSLPIGDDEEVTVQFDQNRIGVNSGDASVVSQLLMGPYPNWERVVPGECTRSWTLDRNEMIDNVSRALILAKDSANRVRFAGGEDSVRVSSRSEEKGEAKEELASIMKNGDIEIAFNGKYVLDALKAMRTQGFRAEMTESSRPAVFRPVEESDDQFCVIMPMQLS